MTEFVKTETKTTIIDTMDGNGPDASLVSITTLGPRAINLVIGARFRDSCASGFSKEGLGDLIKILRQVHGAMV